MSGDPTAPGARTPVDTGVYLDAVRHHAAGVAIVTSVAGGDPVGLTVSTFASHSVSPPTISCDLATSSASLAAIRLSGRFRVHLLADDQEALALRFATRGSDRFGDDAWWWQDGLPALPDVLARFTGELTAEVEVGDHAIVLGTVTDLAIDRSRSPLVHQDRAFHGLRDDAPVELGNGCG